MKTFEYLVWGKSGKAPQRSCLLRWNLKEKQRSQVRRFRGKRHRHLSPYPVSWTTRRRSRDQHVAWFDCRDYVRMECSLANSWHECHTPHPPPMGDSISQSQPTSSQPTSGVPSGDEVDLPSLEQERSSK